MTDREAVELYALLAAYARETESESGPDTALTVGGMADDLVCSTPCGAIPDADREVVQRVFGSG